MNFEVEVPDPIRDKIGLWELTKRMRLLFYETLAEELSSKPNDALTEFVAPVRGLFHKFKIRDPDSGLEHGFFVWVNHTEKEGTRIVIDAKWLI